MADPVAILDAKAREMFEAHVAKQRGRWTLSAFRQGDNPRPAWPELPNHVREEWRTKALLAVSGKERLDAVLRREERERASSSPEPKATAPQALPGQPSGDSR